MTTTIHLLGDAILDNFYWLSDKERDLKKEISDLGYNVVNYAVDNAKVCDLIKGIIPNKKYTTTRTYPYFISVTNEGKIHQLKELLRRININKSFNQIYGDITPIGAAPKNDNLVVVSMGGNNVKCNMSKIILGADNLINSVINQKFLNDYNKVITSIKNSCEKIVLVSLYLPYLGKGSSYSKYSMFAIPVMNKWNAFIEERAKKYNIPLLDLSKMIDVKNKDHYGTSEEYLSNYATKSMAKCITYIYNNYRGYRKYYAVNCNGNNIREEK